MLQSHRLRPHVAVLDSATSVWFPGSPLWYSYAGEQILPYCSLLMMNHVPFDVLLDDDITAGRLDGYDVLVIPRGDTLTRSAHERIVAFARTPNKQVIANATMRARVPGASITDFDFGFERAVDGQYLAQGRALTAEEHRARMETYAEFLRPLVAEYRGPAASNSRRVLINTVESGDLRYIFLVNDDRTYGPRFGASKLWFESGYVTAKIHLEAGPGAGEQAIYDAYAQARRLPLRVVDGKRRAFSSLATPAARGKLLAVLPEPVGRVEVLPRPPPSRGRLPYAARGGRPVGR